MGGSQAAGAPTPTAVPPASQDDHPHPALPMGAPSCLHPKAPQEPTPSPRRAVSPLTHPHSTLTPALHPWVGTHSPRGPQRWGRAPRGRCRGLSSPPRAGAAGQGGHGGVSPWCPPTWVGTHRTCGHGQVWERGSTHLDAWVPSPSHATGLPHPVAPTAQTHRCVMGSGAGGGVLGGGGWRSRRRC